MSKFTDEAEKDCGLWRQYIARNPLTGWFSGIVLGAVIISAAWRLIG